MRALLGPVVLLVVTLGGLLGGSTGAGASASVTSGPCPNGEGVTVVVDPGDLGGSVVVRCAASSPANGLEALTAAGFGVDVTVRFSGFVCRIGVTVNGVRRPQSDPCVDTPPADAYWSYWVADLGGPWCYSELGATARTPVRGTIEGWSFSRGGRDR